MVDKSMMRSFPATTVQSPCNSNKLSAEGSRLSNLPVRPYDPCLERISTDAADSRPLALHRSARANRYDSPNRHFMARRGELRSYPFPPSSPED